MLETCTKFRLHQKVIPGFYLETQTIGPDISAFYGQGSALLGLESEF